MQFVTLNIQYGLGADGLFDIDRTVESVRGADVVALQEVERYWRRSGMRDQPADIARLLPEYHWIYGANLDMDASYQNGDGKIVNRRKQFGTMLLSRTPILSSRNFPLPKYGTRTQHSIQQGVLEGVIDTAAGPVRVYSVHLSHLSSHTRMPQVQVLLDIYKNAPSQGGAWSGGHPQPDAGWLEEDEPPMPEQAVLMGDLNFTHDSPEYDSFVGPMADPHGRLTRRDGFVDAWVAGGHGEAEGTTMNPKAKTGEFVGGNGKTAGGGGNGKAAGGGGNGKVTGRGGNGKVTGKKRNGKATSRRRIDYCLVSANIANRVRSARIDVKCAASDHLPLWVDLDL